MIKNIHFSIFLVAHYTRVCDNFYLPSVENITDTSDDYIKTFELYKKDIVKHSGYMTRYVSDSTFLVPIFKELLRDENFSSDSFIGRGTYLDLDDMICIGCPCDWYGIRPCCNIA